MDTLHSMKLFSEVVESGSFSAAGRRFGLAASSVSRQVGALEESLGARLLNRSTRKLSMTEAGRLYHERVRQILADVEDANRSVSHLEAIPRGLLRINGPVVFGRLHIAPNLPEFMERYPDIDVELTLTDHFVDVIEEGSDVVVRVGGLSDSSLFARRLAPNRRVLCASPEYLERRGRPERPAELAQHDCVLYKRQSTAAIWHICCGESGQKEQVHVSGRIAANNSEALHEVILRGAGIGLLPIWLVGPDIQSGRLERVLPTLEADLTKDETAIHAIYPHKRLLSAKVRAFVDFLVEKYQPVPYWECTDKQAAPPEAGSWQPAMAG
jgi:DNA-binding transcriptional LysR family regulator